MKLSTYILVGLSGLAFQASNALNTCDPSPCQNEGTCNDFGSPRCQCGQGFTGPFCQFEVEVIHEELSESSAIVPEATKEGPVEDKSQDNQVLGDTDDQEKEKGPEDGNDAEDENDAKDEDEDGDEDVEKETKRRTRRDEHSNSSALPDGNIGVRPGSVSSWRPAQAAQAPQPIL